MAGSDRKIHQYTNFNSGEYSPELAGRVDLESFGASTRYMSNMMSQVAGGIKKFYGTNHIAEITPDAGAAKVKFVPFINKYEPMVLVFWGASVEEGTRPDIKVGLIYGNNYKLLDMTFPSSIDVDEMRWKQINDVMIFVHKSIQPLSIQFFGKDDNGDYVFKSTSVRFTEIPYFPVGSLQDYSGELQASGISGEITLSVPSNAMAVRTNFPAPLVYTSTYTRYYKSSHTSHNYHQTGYYVDDSIVKLIRRRNGVDSVLASGVCNQCVQDRHTRSDGDYTYKVTDTITRERILQVIQGTTGYEASYLYGDQIIVMGVSDNQAGDEYYLELLAGQIVYKRYNNTVFPAETYDSVLYETQLVDLDQFAPEQLLGRKIKVYFNDDTVIDPWWQGKTGVTVGDYAYSNGHWYRAETAGTCGNIQPSHTFGMRSDGGVTWLYVHSGSGTATITAVASPTATITQTVGSGLTDLAVDANKFSSIISNSGNYAFVYDGADWTYGGDVVDLDDYGITYDGTPVATDELTVVYSAPSSLTALVEGEELPNTWNGVTYPFKNYAWSIWGYHGVHPSDVYMVGNRLGFICNTDGYGAWNSLSVTDDYYNFSTEEYGEQLDTSAIVHLIGNNESGAINWVLSRKDVYMGSYSGEYNVKGGTNGILTPIMTRVDNISNMGGKPVIPLKYKELNMFVGATGKELYTISYDYTIDDYTPHSLGYLTEHLMDRGIARIEALNNMDRNIYLLHDTQQLSLFNYVREQKIMGFSQLDFGDPVIDFVTTYSNEVVAGYVATHRNRASATISQTRGTGLTNLKVDVVKFGNMVTGDCSFSMEFAITDWYHDGDIIDPADYGITYDGAPSATDELTVEYIAQKVTIERLAIEEPTYMFDTMVLGNGTPAPVPTTTHFAGKKVWVRYGDKFEYFVSGSFDENGDLETAVPASAYYKIGLPMMSEVHTQPAFGQKVEGLQQQSLYVNLRLNKSGAFEYGSSVDFDKYFPCKVWTNSQNWGDKHEWFTGDAMLNIPLGYTENANQGDGPYPNTTGVGLNIRSDTPEPLNLLSIQEIYK